MSTGFSSQQSLSNDGGEARLKKYKPESAPQNNLPWWLKPANIQNPQQSMQIFAPGVDAAIRAAAQPIPEGLSAQDMANMQSRLASQGQLVTRNASANMAAQMGGAASPAFALQAARLQAGAGNATAAKMADVGINEKYRTQDLKMARRGQMADAAKLGLGYGQNMMGWWNAQGQQGAAYNDYLLRSKKHNDWIDRTNSVLGGGTTMWGNMPG